MKNHDQRTSAMMKFAESPDRKIRNEEHARPHAKLTPRSGWHGAMKLQQRAAAVWTGALNRDQRGTREARALARFIREPLAVSSFQKLERSTGDLRQARCTRASSTANERKAGAIARDLPAKGRYPARSTWERLHSRRRVGSSSSLELRNHQSGALLMTGSAAVAIHLGAAPVRGPSHATQGAR